MVAEKVRRANEKANREAMQTEGSSGPYSTVFKLGSYPQRIIIATFDHWSFLGGVLSAWTQAVDGFMSPLSANCYCGNAVHPPSFLNTSTFELTVDPEYSKYVLLIGAQAGSIIHYDTMNVARHIAERRPGDIKVVSLDPMAGYAASKAEEWIPIRPGTDAAFILGLVNLLLNDYRIYDTEFLKKKTNAPYLIGKDGRYVRDKETNRPLVWDSLDGRPKAFDDPSVKDFALEGHYTVDDDSCSPAFEVVRKQMQKYTPEKVSEITGIPGETVKRIAKELGEAACIGQTITIDGVELPYRPVSIVWYRGLSAHKHSYLAGLSAIMLPTILGAIQVPGGVHGHPPFPEYVTEDGLMASNSMLGPPYPPRPAPRPRRVDAFELFPVAYLTTKLVPTVLNDPQRFGIDPDSFVWPELLFVFRDNVVKNSYAPEKVVDGLKKIPFIVALNVDLDETANSLADLVLPELHHLEKLAENLYVLVNEPGYWYAAKPVVKPPFDPPWDTMVSTAQVFLEIAERAGFLERVYTLLNGLWNLRGTPYALDPKAKYAYEELVDRRLKSWLGPDHGFEWLMSDQGGLLV